MGTTDSFSVSERVLIVSAVDGYGRRTVYPASELADKFCALLGQRTLTFSDIEKIKALGFVIKTKEGVLL